MALIKMIFFMQIRRNQLLFVTNITDILPNQGVELAAPSFYDVAMIPSSGNVGTIFKIIVNVPVPEKKYSVAGYADKRIINFNS